MLVVVLVVGSLTAVESLWRQRGIRPSVTDNLDLWSNQRHRVVTEGQRSVVIVGASRAQLDLSLQTLREAYPGRTVVSLAVSGNCGPATLRDLASDTRFNGLVLYSTSGGCLDVGWEDQQEEVDHYHRVWNRDRRFNAWAKAQIQSRLAITSSHTGLFRLMTKHLRRRTLPTANYLVVDADRGHKADYSLVDIERHRAERVQRVTSAENRATDPDRWLQRALTIDTWIHAIEQRGGEVVVIRLPTSDEHWEIDEQVYPRYAYWDALAKASTSNALFLHFRDLAGASDFELPDTSHMDGRDAPAFTHLLVDAIDNSRSSRSPARYQERTSR